MKTFIAYDINTFQILCFITNNYSTINEVSEIFKNFSNYNIIALDNFIMPNNYRDYKIILDENNNFVSMEIIIPN